MSAQLVQSQQFQREMDANSSMSISKGRRPGRCVRCRIARADVRRACHETAIPFVVVSIGRGWFAVGRSCEMVVCTSPSYHVEREERETMRLVNNVGVGQYSGGRGEVMPSPKHILLDIIFNISPPLAPPITHSRRATNIQH